MQTVMVKIDASGNVICLHTPVTAAMFPEAVEHPRASFVEPLKLWQVCIFRALRAAFGDEGRVANWTRDWKCQWIVDCRPINGPMHLRVFSNRAEAIEFEILWLNQNFLNVN